MLPTRDGSLRFFRYSGIDVFVHWSWFLVAVWTLRERGMYYSSPVWNVAEYLGLFGIVLLHEFGHSLACRSTGGRADTIVLWPFGGVAFVDPPRRPGAQLWSIAAGPLVNVALAPFFHLLARAAHGRGLHLANPDLFECLAMIRDINLYLLIFNLLPVYPLDGGQVLRSLLWYRLGEARSLLVAAGIGLAGAAALAACGFWLGRFWLGFIALFLLMNAWRGWRAAREALARMREAGVSDRA